MKTLIAVLALLFSLAGFATTDVRAFLYDGSQDQTQMSLRAEQTHTEYRYEQRQSICYRQEVFYRTVCQGSPRGPICQTVPEYRTVAFPCIQTVAVPYEVHDYFVEANVHLNLVKNSNLPAAESFQLALMGDQLSLSVKGSKNYFILLKNQQVTSNMQGNVKMIDATYSVELVEAPGVVQALSMTNIELQNGVLAVKMGPVSTKDKIGYRLTVKKSPILGSDTVLFDRELAQTETRISDEAAGSTVEMTMADLGIKMGAGRHTLTVNAHFKYEGTLLNKSDFQTLEAGRTLIYKN